MRFPKRRSEFRLGRWTAKKALALYLGRDASATALRTIEIDRAPDGAPAPLVDGLARPQAYLTMTDRADQAVCLVGPPGTALGCDLGARRAAQRRLRRRLPDSRRAAARRRGRGRRGARPPRQPRVVRQGVGPQGAAHGPAPRHAQRRGVVPGRSGGRRLGTDERPRGRGNGLPGLVAALRRVRPDRWPRRSPSPRRGRSSTRPASPPPRPPTPGCPGALRRSLDAAGAACLHSPPPAAREVPDARSSGVRPSASIRVPGRDGGVPRRPGVAPGPARSAPRPGRSAGSASSGSSATREKSPRSCLRSRGRATGTCSCSTRGSRRTSGPSSA